MLDLVTSATTWQQELEALHERISRRFARSEPRNRSFLYLQGLLSPVERKNGWQLAEQIGESTPDGVQRLLNAADWDADLVRDDLRSYVLERLGVADGAEDGFDGIGILDETGFIKKGKKSAGVQRQYSGTAGRIENSQIGVFLCFATSRGAALIDRALYLPKEWILDKERCQEAGVPDSTEFATKPALAKAMLERALDAGMSCRFITGDSVYGSDRKLRLFLEERNQPFVLAITRNEPLMVDFGKCARPSELCEDIDSEAWQRLSVGEGSKGQRLYDFAWKPLFRLQITPEEKAQGHWLLVRRSLDDLKELTFYVVFAPKETTTLALAAQVAGMRWHIENCFESAKGECGLDQYEVRKWDAWHRHITLSMLAHAFLEVVRSQERQKQTLGKQGQKGALPTPLPTPGLPNLPLISLICCR